jgi:predicted porin
MKRKLLPTLIGTALTAGSAGVLAEGANVTFTIYGAADGQFESVSTSGSVDPGKDKPSRFRAQNVSSELGFKGSMPLTDTMTGQFQYLTGISLNNGSANPGGLFAAAKDVFVGLSVANVGTVKIGRLTAAARWNGGMADFSPAGAGPQNDQAALSLVSGQTGITPQFGVRVDKAIGFESANFNGFAVRGYFGANENKSAATVSSGAPIDDKTYSLGLQYAQGPIDARLSYEVRQDKGTLNKTNQDSGTAAEKATHNTRDKDARFGIRYTLPFGTELGFGVDHMRFSDAQAAGATKNTLSRTGWVIGARHPFGQHAIYGGYGNAQKITCTNADGSACLGDNTGAKQFVLAYTYNFTKQMLLEAFVSQLSNQVAAKYDFDSNGLSPGTGAKLSAYGVGLRYTF